MTSVHTISEGSPGAGKHGLICSDHVSHRSLEWAVRSKWNCESHISTALGTGPRLLLSFYDLVIREDAVWLWWLISALLFGIGSQK